MELKIDQKIIEELKEKGYNVNEMERLIQEELMDYDFEGSSLFDLFFYYKGERTLAQGEVIGDVAHCYGVLTKLKTIEL
ncbi:MAG: hypothetical protein NUK57_05530 [Gudongella sp.]|nr:hypothetical protein [Gudongella sp.]